MNGRHSKRYDGPLSRQRRIALGVTLFALVFVTYQHIVNKWPCSLAPHQIDEFGVLLRNFANVMEANGITYMLWEGTLLGAIRDERIIPWTDDIDIAMPYNNGKTLPIMLEALNASGLFVIPPFSEYPPPRALHRIYSPKHYSARESRWQKIWYKALYVDITWMFDDSLFNNMRRVKINGDELWAPSQEVTHEKFVRIYGPDYLIPQDPSCDLDMLFCGAVLPSYCRKFWPLVIPLIATVAVLLAGTHRISSKIGDTPIFIWGILLITYIAFSPLFTLFR